MTATDTQLVDGEVFYCDEGDVFRYIRNKAYDDLPTDRNSITSGGGLSQDDVDDLIAQKSEEADRFTKRAWRTRKVEDVELDIRLSHKQKHSRHRRRKIRGGSRARTNFQAKTRTFVDLPHNNVKPIDSNAGDSIVILNPRSTNDITGNDDREDGDYVLSNRKGVLRPDLDLLTAVGTQLYGPTIQEGVVAARVTYRYGHPYDVTDYDTDGDGVSDYVPPDVEDAVAKLVVADLIGSDQYGEIIPNTGDDSPSLSDASTSFREQGMNTLREYRRA